jgi:DNA-binding transcriptional LysR family regulator
MTGNTMLPNLDVDLLKTFAVLAETGNFTRTAEEVGRTQSAVSMQVKRLEDLVGKPLLVREGRSNTLTADGQMLLDYARRMIQLNDEAMTVFTRPEVSGHVRIGTPDDYADRILPDVLARFARTNCKVQVDVDCQPSRSLIEKVKTGDLDLALVTCETDIANVQVVRTERLLWVTSAKHSVHRADVLPVAFSQYGCAWRQMAIEALEGMGREYRVAYASANSSAISAAVQAGLAVAAIPEICMRPGMRILGEADGFPPLGLFDIGLIRSSKANEGGGFPRSPHRRRHVLPDAECRLAGAMGVAAE